MVMIKHGPAPEDHYTMIPNSLARSADLPPRAKTVYLYLKTHREGWEISTQRIADALGMGKDTVVKAVQDLVDAGYVRRSQVRGEGGTFTTWEYEVLSWPITVDQKSDHGENQALENTTSGKSRPHKKTIPSKKTIFEEDPPVVPQEGDAPKTDPAASKTVGSTSSRKKPRRRLTDDWEPRPDIRESLAVECPTVDQDHELNQFRDYFIANDRTSTDWNLNYRRWIRTENKRNRGRASKPQKADSIKNTLLGMFDNPQEGKQLEWPNSGQQ